MLLDPVIDHHDNRQSSLSPIPTINEQSSDVLPFSITNSAVIDRWRRL
jgi:hypothetical protein